jgi:chromate transporter
VADRPSLRELAVAFLLRGNVTYGGGTATIATLHDELVRRRRWLSEEPFQLSYALSRLTPGTNLLAFTACAGYLLGRAPGALVALLAGSIPCAAMAVTVTGLYESWAHVAVVRVATRGALAAAVAVMVVTGIILVRPHWRSAGWMKLAVFTGGAFVAAHLMDASPIVVLLAAAIAGLVWPLRSPA